MPNDARLGLLVGVGLVLTVAVVFFRKEPASGTPAAVPAAVAETPAVPALTPAPPPARASLPAGIIVSRSAVKEDAPGEPPSWMVP
jgi:hypothetical protein